MSATGATLAREIGLGDQVQGSQKKRKECRGRGSSALCKRGKDVLEGVKLATCHIRITEIEY